MVAARRIRWLAFAALAALALASGSRAAHAACQRPESLAKTHSEIASLINAFRREHGLQSVAQFHTLNKVATAYACLLARTGHFDHTGPDGSVLEDRARSGGYAFCRIAENLARGHRSPPDVVSGWINSPDHRANLLLSGVDQFGLGVVVIPDDAAPEADDKTGSLSQLAQKLDTQNLHTRGAGLIDGQRFVWVLLMGSRCT